MILDKTRVVDCYLAAVDFTSSSLIWGGQSAVLANYPQWLRLKQVDLIVDNSTSAGINTHVVCTVILAYLPATEAGVLAPVPGVGDVFEPCHRVVWHRTVCVGPDEYTAALSPVESITDNACCPVINISEKMPEDFPIIKMNVGDRLWVYARTENLALTRFYGVHRWDIVKS